MHTCIKTYDNTVRTDSTSDIMSRSMTDKHKQLSMFKNDRNIVCWTIYK